MLELYNLLNKAEAAGISTTNAEVVYNDANSTTDQLKSAIEQLKNSLNSASLQGATVANPKDASSCIINPNFDSGNMGWTMTGTVYNPPTTQWSGNIGSVSNNCMESWNSVHFDIYQVLKGMPDGIYRASVNGYYRYGANEYAVSSHKDNSEMMNSYLYGDNDSTALNNVLIGANKKGDMGFSTELGYIPDNVANARDYFDAAIYPNSLFIVKEGSDTLRLGIKKSNGLAGDWTVFSNFKLTFYGAGADAYKLVLQDAIDKAMPYSEKDDQMGNDVKINLTDALNKANQMIAGNTAKNDEMIALGKQLGGLVSDVKVSIEAYANLAASFAGAENCINTFGGDELSDYYGAVQSAWDNGDLSTKECYAAVDSIAKLIEYTKIHAVKVGDCSFLLTNPGFSENKSNGWTFTNCTPTNVDQSEIEFWQKDFDMSQTLRGIQNGKYTIRCKGYYRAGSNGDAYTGYKAGTNVLRAKLYANSDESSIQDVMSEAQTTGLYLQEGIGGTFPYDYITSDGTAVPNSMAGARIWMDAGFYNHNSVSTIVTDNTLKLGVRLKNYVSDCWCLVDSFTIEYEGTDDSVLQPVLNALVEKANGLIDSPMNADSLTALKKTIGDVSSSPSNTLAAITAINSAIHAAERSIAAYATLGSELKLVEDTLSAATYPDAMEKLSNLYSEVSDKHIGGSYADADIPAVIASLKVAIIQYLTAHAAGADDDNPVDVTSVIVNASFDAQLTGWTTTGEVGGGNIGRWANSTVESWNSTSFDIGQTIIGLPNGTYKLSATGYYRCSSNNTAAAKHNDGTEKLNAILYGDSITQPIMSIFSQPMSEMVTDGFEKVGVPFNGQDFCYVPNSMDAARISFDKGLYADNSLFVDVTDGTLKIGVRKTDGIADDWTILDLFKIVYYGTHSSHTGISSTVDSKVVVGTTYYSLNGMMMKKPVRGLNIVKTTFSDGTSKIHKIIVR
jgi:hypothetical protein